MKRLSLTAAALALASGLASAQDSKSQRQTETAIPAQAESAQISVGKDTQDTLKTGSEDAAAARDVARERGSRGAGVATSFVAAGIGLALLGLFVRRRNRRSDEDDFGDINRPGGPSSGPGPQP